VWRKFGAEEVLLFPFVNFGAEKVLTELVGPSIRGTTSTHVAVQVPSGVRVIAATLAVTAAQLCLSFDGRLC
jgi:hypothetical protein